MKKSGKVMASFHIVVPTLDEWQPDDTARISRQRKLSFFMHSTKKHTAGYDPRLWGVVIIPRLW